MPIDDESVDGFFMCRAFQRITGTKPLMSELYRVAKPNARFLLRFRALPEAGDTEALGDYVSSAFARFAQPARPSTSSYAADWQPIRIKLIVDASQDGDAELSGYLDPTQLTAREVLVELRAVKPARPKDPRLLELPKLTISRSAIDLESVFI